MSDEAPEEFRALARQPKRDRSAKGVPNYPGGRELQVLHQCSEVSDVLSNAALSTGALALAVSTARYGPETNRPNAEPLGTNRRESPKTRAPERAALRQRR